jgi:hypothetical protein
VRLSDSFASADASASSSLLAGSGYTTVMACGQPACRSNRRMLVLGGCASPKVHDSDSIQKECAVPWEYLQPHRLQVATTTGKQRTRRLKVQRALGRRRNSLVTEVAPGVKGCSVDLRRERGQRAQAVCSPDYIHGICTAYGFKVQHLMGRSNCRYSLLVKQCRSMQQVRTCN